MKNLRRAMLQFFLLIDIHVKECTPLLGLTTSLSPCYCGLYKAAELILIA